MPHLEQLHAEHAGAVLAFELANRAYFALTIADRGDDYFEHFPEQYDALVAEQAAGLGAYYLLVDDCAVLGRFNLTFPDQGADRATATLGYRVAAAATGRGVASATVRDLCRIASTQHAIRTIRAVVSDANPASRQVLVNAAFAVVGPATAADLGGKPGTWFELLLTSPRRAYEPPTQRTLAWVAQHVDIAGRVVAVTPLLGGTSAAMDRVTVESSAGVTDVVLRRWPVEEGTPGLVAREAAALIVIRGCGVPTPELVARDADGAETGVRCTLTSIVAGQPDLAPTDLASWVGQLATTQAAIHDVPARLETVPDRYADRHRALDWLTDPGLRAAARAAAAGPLVDEQVLVHGDYQPYNVLWQDGRLTGIVDWPHAGVGSRGTDVGHCRLNLAVLFDAATADDYLVAYERAAGVRVDRRADLRALLCFDLDWQRFIPHQVGGRARVDVPGMPARVAVAVRHALDAMDRL